MLFQTLLQPIQWYRFNSWFGNCSTRDYWHIFLDFNSCCRWTQPSIHCGLSLLAYILSVTSWNTLKHEVQAKGFSRPITQFRFWNKKFVIVRCRILGSLASWFLLTGLCLVSKRFLASPLSSWSQSVLLDRMVEDKEYESVLDVLYDGKFHHTA